MDVADKLCKMFQEMREELLKGKGNAPTPKGEKKPKKKVPKSKEQDNSELTDEQRKAIKSKGKDTKETRTASVPGVRRTAEGGATFYGRALGAHKIVPKKEKHIVEQAIRTIRTPTKKASITIKKADDGK